MATWVEEWSESSRKLCADPTGAGTLDSLEQILRSVGTAIGEWFVPELQTALGYPGRSAERTAVERWGFVMTQCARHLADPAWKPTVDVPVVKPVYESRWREILVEWADYAVMLGLELADLHDCTKLGDYPLASVDAFALGFHAGSLHERIDAAVIKMNSSPGHPTVDPAEDAALLQRVEEARRRFPHMKKAGLAEEVGVSRSTLYRVLERNPGRIPD